MKKLEEIMNELPVKLQEAIQGDPLLLQQNILNYRIDSDENFFGETFGMNSEICLCIQTKDWFFDFKYTKNDVFEKAERERAIPKATFLFLMNEFDDFRQEIEQYFEERKQREEYRASLHAEIEAYSK
jgi:hypothetical protein